MRILVVVIFYALKLYYKFCSIIVSTNSWRAVKTAFDYAYLRHHGIETAFGDVTLVGLPYIQKHPESRIVLKKGVTIISNSRGNPAGINHPSILATLAPGALIELDQCGISGATLCAVKMIKMKKNSGLGANVSVYDTDFHIIDHNRMHQKSILEAKSDSIIIEENAWVGAGCIILKGVTIGQNAVVGAGTVIRNDVAPYTVTYGRENLQEKLLMPFRTGQ